jgi:hypothetical protein
MRASALLLALVLQGCVAGRMESIGGSGFAGQFGPELDEDARQKARSAEAERVRGELWAVVGSAGDALGAVWTFRYWSEGGALTLLSFQLTEAGSGMAAHVKANTFLPRFARRLPALLGTSAREVTFTLTRQESGWTVDFDTSTPEAPPPQARTLPSPRRGVSVGTYEQVLTAARGMAQLMRVSAGNRSRIKVEVFLEDNHVMGWQPTSVQATGKSLDAPVTEAELSRAATALQPFTHALGVRTVEMILEGGVPANSTAASWRVAEARTREPPRPPKEMEDIAQAYRALHERILYDFQHELREGAILLAGLGLEQLAYWYVGGLIARGAFFLFEATAPTVVALLSQGGQTMVRWFRNLLFRTPIPEREALKRLWLKAETQGLTSLSAVEAAELRGLMGRMERLLHTPLDNYAKGEFRAQARKEFFAIHNPKLAELLGETGREFYEIHHLHPLQYAHLFPRLDINSVMNLACVPAPAHRSINSIWASLGDVSSRMSPDDVTKVVHIINNHYQRWFNRPYDPATAPLIAEAKSAALLEVAALKALLTR